MKRPLWTTLAAVGGILVVAAIVLALWNVHTDLRASRSRDTLLVQLAEAMPEEEPAAPVYEPEPVAEEPELPSVPIDGRNYMGAIRFPILSLELPVLAEYSLEALKVAPAVYSGTPEGRDLVICGHNYRAHFGPLVQLQPGDEVLMQCVDGTVYRYSVSATEIVSPYAVEDVTSGQWDLTLFTCTMGGQSRFVVRCDLI